MVILSGHFIKSKRGVSQVVGSMMLIALVLAAGASVTFILNTIEGDFGVETTDTGIGSLGSNVDGLNFEISLAKSSFDLQIFAAEGKKYYTSITVNITYTGGANAPNYIYVTDVDMIVYGEKLDEKVPWEIEAFQGANPEFDGLGNVIGYKQAKGTSAKYTVVLTDPSVISARLFYETSFTYQAKVGTTPGIVEYLIENEEISKIEFDVVRYNVSIIHYGQSISDPSSGVGYWNDVMGQSNGSNKIFFIFNANNDLYDVSAGDLNGLNLTQFNEYYQLVIFAEWAIHNSASVFATTLHNLGMPMVFGGSIVNIISSINTTATEEIVGITPTPHTNNERISESSYTFNNSISNLLINIQNRVEYPYTDTRGADVGVLAPNTDAQIYATSHIELYSNHFAWFFGGTPAFEMDGVAMVSKEANITSGTGFTASLILQHEYASYAKMAMRNMLFYIFKEPERIIVSEAVITLDSIVRSIRNRLSGVNFVYTATTSGGDIQADTLAFTLLMDKNIGFISFDYRAKITIGGVVVDRIDYSIFDAGDYWRVDIAVGVNYGLDIPEGSQIVIELERNGGYMRTNNWELGLLNGIYPWTFKLEWLSMAGGYGSVSETI